MKLVEYLLPAFALVTASISICPSRYCRRLGSDNTPSTRNGDEAVRWSASQKTSRDVSGPNDSASLKPDTLLMKRSAADGNQEGTTGGETRKSWYGHMLEKVKDPHTSPEEKARLQAYIDRQREQARTKNRYVTPEEAEQVLDPQEMEKFREARHISLRQYGVMSKQKTELEERGGTFDGETMKRWNEVSAANREYRRLSRYVARKLDAAKKVGDSENSPEEKKGFGPYVGLGVAEQILDSREMETFRELSNARSRYNNNLNARNQARKEGRPITDEQLRELDESYAAYKKYMPFSRDVAKKLEDFKASGGKILTGQELKEWRAKKGLETSKNLKKNTKIKKYNPYIGLEEASQVLNSEEMEKFKELREVKKRYQRVNKAMNKAKKEGHSLTDIQPKDWEGVLSGYNEYQRFSRDVGKKLEAFKKNGHEVTTPQEEGTPPHKGSLHELNSSFETVKKYVQHTSSNLISTFQGSNLVSAFQRAASTLQRAGSRPLPRVGPVLPGAGPAFR